MSTRGESREESRDDLLRLLTLLNDQLLIELGKPLPRPECLPKLSDPRCPASHNRALLDHWDEKKGRRP